MFILLLFIAAGSCGEVVDHTPRLSNAWTNNQPWEKINVYITVIDVENLRKYKSDNIIAIPWDSAFDKPDVQVSIKVNGVERWTDYCSNTSTCNCPGKCNMEWLDVSEPFEYTVTVWDHDISSHDKIAEGTYSFSDYHRRDDDSVSRVNVNEATFKAKLDVLVKYIYKPCTTRTPISGSCTGSYETKWCYTQPLPTSSVCVTSCNQFYQKSTSTENQCIPQKCTSRKPVDGKCWSNDYVPEYNCGYLSGLGCGTCNIHYTISRDGVCILKPCSERIAWQWNPSKPSLNNPTSPCGDSCNWQPNGKCDTGCPLNYEAVNGSCSLKTCSERKYPCHESTNCFQQLDPAGDGTHSTTCGTACGESLSVKDAETSSCQLKVCEQRTPNLTHTAFPCGDSSCLRVVHADDPIGVCASSCNPAHFIAESIPGHCHAMVCEERRKVDGTSPCGPGDCYWDLGDTDADRNPNQTKCTSNCTNYKHFRMQESNHTCVLMDCTERQEHLTGGGDWPCGPRDEEPLGCYANTGRDGTNGGTECATACSNSEHYSLDPATGRCIEKDCENRTRNSSATAPCGSGMCYVDSNAYAETNESEAVYGQCRPFCMNPDHFAPDTAIGECVERECKFRTPNTSETVPCGSGFCFADTGAGPNVCKDLQHQSVDSNDWLIFDDACTHTVHYEAVEAKHRCILRKCEERKEDDRAVYHCGDQSCFLQPPGVDRACDTACPDTYMSDDTGVCITIKAKSNVASVVIPIVVVIVVILVIVAVITIVMIQRKHMRNKSGGGSGHEGDLDSGSGKQELYGGENNMEAVESYSGSGKNVLLEDAAGVDKAADVDNSTAEGVRADSCKAEADVDADAETGPDDTSAETGVGEYTDAETGAGGLHD